MARRDESKVSGSFCNSTQVYRVTAAAVATMTTTTIAPAADAAATVGHVRCPVSDAFRFGGANKHKDT